MRTVTRDEFEVHASELLREARAGETVQIEDDGMIVELKLAERTPESADEVWRGIFDRRARRPVIAREDWARWKHEGHRH